LKYCKVPKSLDPSGQTCINNSLLGGERAAQASLSSPLGHAPVTAVPGHTSHPPVGGQASTGQFMTPASLKVPVGQTVSRRSNLTKAGPQLSANTIKNSAGGRNVSASSTAPGRLPTTPATPVSSTPLSTVQGSVARFHE
jgi:hypothetical protein